MIKWWGYVHVNGTLHVKRYFDMGDLREAAESDFVAFVYGTWDIDNREDAMKKLERLDNG